MIKILSAIAIMVFLVSQNSFAEFVTFVSNDASTLKVRQFTTQNQTPSIRNCVGFVVRETPWAQFAYLNIDTAGDRATYALILSAISQGKKISIIYDSLKPSPWDNQCFAIVEVRINE
jgi:hypothetical protein